MRNQSISSAGDDWVEVSERTFDLFLETFTHHKDINEVVDKAYKVWILRSRAIAIIMLSNRTTFFIRMP